MNWFVLHDQHLFLFCSIGGLIGNYRDGYPFTARPVAAIEKKVYHRNPHDIIARHGGFLGISLADTRIWECERAYARSHSQIRHSFMARSGEPAWLNSLRNGKVGSRKQVKQHLDNLLNCL